MRHELDLLHDVFNRRLEQIKQKYLSAGVPSDLEQAKIDSRNKDLFTRASERIDDFFVRVDLNLNPASDVLHKALGIQELEDQLFSLEREVQQAIKKLLNSYAEKARTIDEYILHPNLKDIHFARSCILWMPVKAE
jgi:hypothetical protein